MAIAAPKPSRIEELTALRGMAALVVLFSHLLLIYPLSRETLVAAGFLINPHAAVILFFVLSGFVLARSLENVTAIFWSRSLRFWLKRLFRIYPAIWAATALAIILVWLRPDIPDTILARWPVNHMANLSLHNITMTLAAWNAALIPPLWTIYVELVGSLFVPFMVWIARKSKLAGLAMVAVLAALSLAAKGWPHPWSASLYLVHFALGVIIAVHGQQLRKTPALLFALSGLAGLTVFRTIYFFGITGEWKMGTYDYGNPAPGLMEGFAATMLVAALANGALALAWLRSGLMRALGEWSYSLYLTHLPIMLFLACLLPAQTPVTATVLLGGLTLIGTLLVSSVIHRMVELPGIALGKRIARRFIPA
ncbi:MAG: acyltransferase [Sphingomonadaceae bacterium]|nr:acyltransferase [Sphingomonadaceae bacterium]